VKKI
jgi:hypothetical protein